MFHLYNLLYNPLAIQVSSHRLILPLNLVAIQVLSLLINRHLLLLVNLHARQVRSQAHSHQITPLHNLVGSPRRALLCNQVHNPHLYLRYNHQVAPLLNLHYGPLLRHLRNLLLLQLYSRPCSLQ